MRGPCLQVYYCTLLRTSTVYRAVQTTVLVLDRDVVKRVIDVIDAAGV